MTVPVSASLSSVPIRSQPPLPADAAVQHVPHAQLLADGPRVDGGAAVAER